MHRPHTTHETAYSGDPHIHTSPVDDADDMALVQEIAEGIRARIQAELDAMTGARRSVWFG